MSIDVEPIERSCVKGGLWMAPYALALVPSAEKYPCIRVHGYRGLSLRLARRSPK